MKTTFSLTSLALLAALGNGHPLGVNVADQDMHHLVARQGSTENAQGCSDIMIVFARGTTEPGNVGVVAGPPMFASIRKSAAGKSVGVQGVTYPADIPGFFAGGDAKGSAEMANQVKRIAGECPQAKMVMSGYSQGGQLVHKAATMLPGDVANRVNAVVIFGDPNNPKPVDGMGADKTMVICHQGDMICTGAAIILPAHLTYGQDADAAAKFVMSKVQ